MCIVTERGQGHVRLPEKPTNTEINFSGAFIAGVEEIGKNPLCYILKVYLHDNLI
jgi:hypothetical protein